MVYQMVPNNELALNKPLRYAPSPVAQPGIEPASLTSSG